MKILKPLLACLCLLSSFCSVIAEANITGVQCHFNPDICNPSYCAITNPRGKMKYFSFGCSFIKSINDVWVQLQILRKTNKGEEPITKMIRQNLCDFDNFNDENYVMNRLMAMSAKQIKLVKCPFQGNVSSKIPVMLHIASGLLPESNYILRGKVFREKLIVLDMNISFKIFPSKMKLFK